ncbi:DUF881 domain-containing protein [Nocardioides sp.]|uniref:DUF881 domain-containing protein n=1 Tax=Nocardioides sp. TaxID=35761 RepID=UPI003511EC6D
MGVLPRRPARRPPAADGGSSADLRARLPLLVLLSQQALEEDYLAAARRRASGAAPRPPGRAQRTAAVVVAVFGIMAATAFVQTRSNADIADESRATLISRIESQRERVARQQERLATLRARTGALEQQNRDLGDTEQEASLQVVRLGVQTGFAAARGEGVRIEVLDPPGPAGEGSLLDSDLALAVNGLWEAGAEAIAVNGNRLSTRSAVRSSGQAIQVNTVGISSPFVIEAIGDTATLGARLFETSSGLAFLGRVEGFGLEYSVENVSDLRLPATPPTLRTLRSASVAPQDRTDPEGSAP